MNLEKTNIVTDQKGKYLLFTQTYNDLLSKSVLVNLAVKVNTQDLIPLFGSVVLKLNRNNKILTNIEASNPTTNVLKLNKARFLIPPNVQTTLNVYITSNPNTTLFVERAKFDIRSEDVEVSFDAPPKKVQIKPKSADGYAKYKDVEEGDCKHIVPIFKRKSNEQKPPEAQILARPI